MDRFRQRWRAGRIIAGVEPRRGSGELTVDSFLIPSWLGLVLIFAFDTGA